MRRIFVSALLLVVAWSGMYAGGSGESSEAGPEYTLTFAHVQPEDHAYHLMAVQFKEELERISNGRVAVEIYPAGQLGDERDLVEALQIGTVDVTTITSALTSGFVPEFAVFSLPFLFEDFDHLYAVMDGPIGDDLEAAMRREGLIKLGFVSGGSRSMYASNPVTSLADLQGMSIRTMEDPVYIETWNALGALATPVPWGDVYLSLEQGIVDGAEGALISYRSMGFYDSSPHVTVINYVFSWHNFMMGDATWSTLPDDVKEMIREAGQVATDWQREYVANLEAELLDILVEEHGSVIHYPDDLSAWQNAIQHIYEERAERVGGMDLIETIINTR